MPSMSENLPNRVRKLTKPGNASQALQPFFEAVSNAFMAIDDRQAVEEGKHSGPVVVEITSLGGNDMVITVREAARQTFGVAQRAGTKRSKIEASHCLSS